MSKYVYVYKLGSPLSYTPSKSHKMRRLITMLLKSSYLNYAYGGYRTQSSSLSLSSPLATHCVTVFILMLLHREKLKLTPTQLSGPAATHHSANTKFLFVLRSVMINIFRTRLDPFFLSSIFLLTPSCVFFSPIFLFLLSNSACVFIYAYIFVVHFPNIAWCIP